MESIFDEAAVPVGAGYELPLDDLLIYVNRLDQDTWYYNAGGTDLVTIRAAGPAGFSISDGHGEHHRDDFVSAAHLALRLLGIQVPFPAADK